MKLAKYIFRSRLAFEPIDPLGDGLREMIRREQSESQAIRLHEDEFDTGLWREMAQDMHGSE